MNVFDFDGTIYAGDSSVDFWLFCLRNDWRLLRFLPRQVGGVVLHRLGRITKEECKGRYFCFVAGVADVDGAVRRFWDAHMRKVRPWYRAMQRADDCIISASPQFLLAEPCARLGIRNLIATQADKRTGRLTGANCHGANKVAFFRARFGDMPIDAFYTDSQSDAPMAHISKHAFMVKGKKIQRFGVDR